VQNFRVHLARLSGMGVLWIVVVDWGKSSVVWAIDFIMTLE